MSNASNMDFVLGRATAAPARAKAGESGRLFRVLVLGDFSGRASRGADRDAPPSFVPAKVDIDNFDAVLAKLTPDLHLRLADNAQTEVKVGVRSLEAFEPDALYATVPLFRSLRELRTRLANPATFEAAAAELRAQAPGAPAVPSAAPVATTGTPSVPEDDAATMARLMGGVMPPPPPSAGVAAAANTVDGAVDRLIRGMVAPHIVPATAHLQQPLLDSLDRAIASAMRGVIHHPHWRALEGNWRSVDQFVRTVEMDGQVLLEIVDATAADLLQSLAAAGGDAARMPLARSLAARRLHEGEEEGYAVVVGLYEFGSSAAELALLAGLGALAAGEGAAFIAAASPALALVDAPDAWADHAPLARDTAAQARWAALRDSWVAPHVGLVWPRLLGRLPYGPRSQPVQSFAFDELAEQATSGEELPWRPAALDLAALLARAYVDSGWSLALESAVTIDDLPAFTDRRGPEPRAQAVAELFMSERQAQAIHAAGVMALVSHRGLPQARLAGWRSIALKSHRLQGRWEA